MLTDNIRIAKKRVDLILREAPFIGIIRIRFTGYNLSRDKYPKHPCFIGKVNSNYLILQINFYC